MRANRFNRSPIRIGIDFDNTVICYDKVIRAVAAERGIIPADCTPSKDRIRNYLRSMGKENIWTELQGLIYGDRIDEAEPFPGVFDFFGSIQKLDLPAFIISHKTRYPYKGLRYDLNKAAYQWLERNRFLDPDAPLLARERVFFEPSKEAKIKRIIQLECTHFIDDLPEFLDELASTHNITCILFDPNDSHRKNSRFLRVSSWNEMFETFENEITRKSGFGSDR